jgi:DNA (cytosine-5)-methyltransferase 1
MKILNLYACLGGNRYKWGNEHEITAVELDPVLCELYKERFQNDTVICTDAHEYLLNHYKEFDFIWSSPPCPSHSRIRFGQANSERENYNPIYPDMTLYQEIILLQNYFDGFFCVENVIPYYEPLIPGKKRGRHIYWTNFAIPEKIDRNFTGVISTKNELKLLSEFHDYDFRKYKGSQRVVKIARNLVDYEAGKSILDAAIYSFEQRQNKQLTIFS